MKTPVSLYGALMTVHVPQDKARDVADALESDMTTALASRQDVESLGLLLRHDIELLRADFAALRTEMRACQDSRRVRDEWREHFEAVLAKQTTQFTVGIGGMLAAGLGLLFAALKLTS